MIHSGADPGGSQDRPAVGSGVAAVLFEDARQASMCKRYGFRLTWRNEDAAGPRR